jgi:hypothetical protein
VSLRTLGTWALFVGLALPACASEQSGTISGYVRDSSGVPQMGAVVEISHSTSRSLTVYTDGAGFYSAGRLLPGFYTVKVSAASFLPALREKIGLRPGSKVHVNITLNTLLDVMQLGPLRSTTDQDDWKWTLRSVANRPILRVLDDPSSALEKQQGHDVSGQLSFLAGSTAEGYGSGSDMSTAFSLERPIFAASRIGLSGNVGYADTFPAATLHTVYSNRLADGSELAMAVSVRHFAPSDPNLHNAALQSLGFAAGDDIPIGDVVELKFGSELQTIQFLGHMSAFRPYGAADLHFSPDSVLEYDYSSSLPESSLQKDSESASSELTEANPRLSVANFAPQLESPHHQELHISQRLGNNSVQLAVFSDRVANTALIGAGNVTAAGGFLLPDIYSGTFTYTGGTLDTRGVRVVLERKFSSDLTATLDYGYGGALDLVRPDVELQNAQQWVSTQRRHAVAAKLSGTVPRAHTRWIASYRWTNRSALTPVDMFNASPGETDAYLNLVIRQPIPSLGFLPGHMDAIIDLRNLLAQGYVPVLGQDGQTVYLVQSARAVRGGLAFNF